MYNTVFKADLYNSLFNGNVSSMHRLACRRLCCVKELLEPVDRVFGIPSKIIDVIDVVKAKPLAEPFIPLEIVQK